MHLEQVNNQRDTEGDATIQASNLKAAFHRVQVIAHCTDTGLLPVISQIQNKVLVLAIEKLNSTLLGDFVTDLQREIF